MREIVKILLTINSVTPKGGELGVGDRGGGGKGGRGGGGVGGGGEG